jgi:hypothetical protein
MASTKNAWAVDVEYALGNFIEIEAVLKHSSEVESYGTVDKYFYFGKESYQSANEQIGWDDLLLVGTFRMPLKSDFIEIALVPSIQFPIAERYPEMPVTTIKTEGTTTKFTETTYSTTSKGTITYGGVIQTKLRFNQRTALQLWGGYSTPSSNVSTIEWESNNNGEIVTYASQSVSVNNPEVVIGGAQLQWVPDRKELACIILSGNYTKYAGGSQTKENGTTSFEDKETFIATIGLELIVSNRIRFYQEFFYSVVGTNTKSPIGFAVALKFNFLRKTI